MRWLLIGAMVAMAPAVQAQDTTQAAPRRPGNPLRGVVRVGNVLYLSGQAGTIPGGGGVAPGGVAGEVRQTLENLKRVLEREGSSMDRVAKCLVFLTNMADFQTMNDVYRTFFPKDPPARSTVQVSALARPELHVEIECIAEAGPKP